MIWIGTIEGGWLAMHFMKHKLIIVWIIDWRSGWFWYLLDLWDNLNIILVIKSSTRINVMDISLASVWKCEKYFFSIILFLIYIFTKTISSMPYYCENDTPGSTIFSFKEHNFKYNAFYWLTIGQIVFEWPKLTMIRMDALDGKLEYIGAWMS